MSTSRAPTRSLARQPAYYEHARSYNRDTGVFQPYRRAVVEALPPQPGQVVLDVGRTLRTCGTIDIDSRPGRTVLRVQIPVRAPEPGGHLPG